MCDDKNFILRSIYSAGKCASSIREMAIILVYISDCIEYILSQK